MNNNFEFDALGHAKNYRRWICDIFSPYLGETTLEVGAGIGQNSKVLAEVGAEKLICIEPDKSYLTRLKQNAKNATIIHGTIKDIPPTLMPDSIVSINVLEHIEKDSKELKNYAKVLSPKNGYLCILVPARMEIYSEIDKLFGHYRRYNKQELSAKLTENNFSIQKIYYSNFLGYITWLATFKFGGKLSFTPSQVKLYDRIAIPIIKIIESSVKPPVGQSIIAIAQAD
jgi:SAM-dependent methyltransferase